MITAASLLLVDSPGDPFMDRIRAEVVSLGLEGVVRAPQGSIEAKARAEHAVAAIRILPSRNGVEVWMADAASGRSLLRQVIVDETPGRAEPGCDRVADRRALAHRSISRDTTRGPRPVPAPPVIVQSAPARSDGESALGTGVELALQRRRGQPSLAGVVFVSAPVESPSRDRPRCQCAVPSRHDERTRRHGGCRCDRRRCRDARAFQVRARRPVPDHRAGGGAGGVADERTSEPGRERPGGEQLFHRLHRPRVRADHPGLQAVQLARSGDERPASERRSPASTFDLAATMQATGACRCWGPALFAQVDWH